MFFGYCNDDVWHIRGCKDTARNKSCDGLIQSTVVALYCLISSELKWIGSAVQFSSNQVRWDEMSDVKLFCMSPRHCRRPSLFHSWLTTHKSFPFRLLVSLRTDVVDYDSVSILIVLFITFLLSFHAVDCPAFLYYWCITLYQHSEQSTHVMEHSPGPSVHCLSVGLSAKCIVAKWLIGSGCHLGRWVGWSRDRCIQWGWLSLKLKGKGQFWGEVGASHCNQWDFVE